MKNGISINERIKDLRTNKHMRVEDISDATGIPKQTLSNYEKDDYPVPHHIVLQLAAYYNVSTDYLLGLTDSPASVHTPVSDLHLSDAAIARIRDSKTNSRLLSEIIESDAFMQLLVDSEVYVDGYVEESVDQYNSLMNFARKKVAEHIGVTDDAAAQTLAHSKVAQHEYFGRLFANDLIEILDEIKENHSKDRETSDGAYTEEDYQYIHDVIKANRSGPLKGLSAGIKAALHIAKNKEALRDSDTLIDGNQFNEEALTDMLSQSPIIEPDARKRRKR